MKNQKTLLLILSFVLSTGLSSCKKDNPVPEALDPSNLNVIVEQVANQVNVHATADNTNFYTVIFYDVDDTVFVETATGEASYTFNQSGTYKIVSRANSTHDNFVEKVNLVTVSISSTPSGAPPSGYTTSISHPGYNLVWSEEFNGSALSNDWTFDIGTGSSGWGNNELQYYTDQNYTVGNGFLEIVAKEETFNSQQFTSTRLKTQGLKSWKYGRIDVRAALPFGKGIWPAIWMLGNNISSVSWPACGEIDIMELIGGEGVNDRTVHGTAHWEENGHAQYGDSYSLTSGKFSDEFHVFSIVWDETSIKWLVDDVQYNQLTLNPAQMNELQQNFFLILNIAVGGNWPGSPDATTVFPQRMYVDYIRVFQ